VFKPDKIGEIICVNKSLTLKMNNMHTAIDSLNFSFLKLADYIPTKFWAQNFTVVEFWKLTTGIIASYMCFLTMWACMAVDTSY